MSPTHTNTNSDTQLRIQERALSAAGAAFVSAIIVNPLDVAKTPHDIRCSAVSSSEPPLPCPSVCNRYKGTLDVLYKVTRQEGFPRLWRGTSASLALAVPTAFRATQSGKPPGVWKTLLGVIHPDKGTNIFQSLHRYRFWWTGLGAQLSRDVPYSAICWSTLEPIRKSILGLAGDRASAATVLGANFSAGFVAGTLASAATCPLDVAKTRRQIEKDPERALKMTTRTTLLEIWRDGGLRGLFTGVAPRVGRAGPSVGIVVSFYEVVKYVLQLRHPT
ncbi:hypothetical protein JHK87_008382 [Glycine soja]|nr:hypothetical protein JHK87_008382 [Glycine soja]